MKQLPLALFLLVLAPAVAWAQPSLRGLPPTCTVETINDGTCAPEVRGMRAVARDGATTSDCTTGGGANSVRCVYTGSAWLAEDDEYRGAINTVIFCGDVLGTGEPTVTYFGPASAAWGGDGSDASIDSAACQALDSATEGNVDAALLTDSAIQVLGMYCVCDGEQAADETLTFVVRADEDDVTASGSSTGTITCQIAEGEVDCATNAGSTTNVAAGDPMAIKVTEVGDNASDNAWCRVTVVAR